MNGNDVIPGAASALKLLRTSRPCGSTAKAYYESKVLETLALIMQWGEDQLRHEEKTRLRDWELNSLQEVSRYLKQHYAEPIPLETLARLACMSRNKLTTAFKQAHGLTITEYIQELRLEKAKDLLLNSDWDVGEIAGTVGYKLHRSFSEAFKEATGITPSEFRRQTI